MTFTQNSTQYHIVMENTEYTSVYETIFLDLFQNHSVIKITEVYEDTGFKRLFLNLLYKNKINSLLKGRFEPVLKPHFSLEASLQRHKDARNVVIFLNPCMQKVYSADNLQRIKQSVPNTRFVLLFVDMLSQYQAEKAYEISKSGVFDLIYTFDHADAEQSNLLFWYTPYSKSCEKPDTTSNSVYFCGNIKCRGAFLNRIATTLKEKGIPYTFDVFCEKEEDEYLFPIQHTGFLPYQEMLQKALLHNCILDVVQDGQAGLSLRIMEAIVYDRVLITNNPNILNHPLYNPMYMHYILDPAEIRPEWISAKAQYHYAGEMSPLHFIKNIHQRLFP